MPMERLTMRKIREVFRLKYGRKLSNTEIAASCNISRETVRKYLFRAKEANLHWPFPEELDDTQLEAKLFPYEYKESQATLPDLKWVHQELKKRGVTRWLLWEEYRSENSSGISYSQFCDRYRCFKKGLDPVMRQAHKAGEKLFVDYAGMTLSWSDQTTGEIFDAQIFVATLGASNYTYVEATRSQQLGDWIASHVRAFSFFGGVPDVVVPDNLKSGVTKAHRYDPDINPTYQELANHYGVAVVPARANRPKDKAIVESNVKVVENRILAKLRNRQFFSLLEINQAIKELLTEYNAKPFQKLNGSRLSEFIATDQPALKPLPNYKYEYAQWKKVRVGVDYHVAFEHHYYSVPYEFIKQEIDLRMTGTTIQCYVKGKLIATHVRAYRKGHSTVKAHMPKSHQEYLKWTPEKILSQAKAVGEKTNELIMAMIQGRPHPQQAFGACLGVLRLGKQYGSAKLEKAAQRALALGSLSYQSIASILKHGLEDKPLPDISATSQSPVTHENVRGSDYFH